MLTNTPHPRQHFASNQRGSALLEGLIAILIFSFGILAMVGLQANSMRIATESKMRIDASYIANQQLGEMWVKQDSIDTYAGEKSIEELLPNGKRIVEISGNKDDGFDVTITVTWQMPGDSNTQSFSTVSRINGNKKT